MSTIDFAARGMVRKLDTELLSTDAGKGQALIGRPSAAELASSDAAARGEGAKWYAGPFAYTEAASDASDHHLTTAGGVKLYVDPDASGSVHLAAWGLPFDGSVAHDGILAAAQSISGVQAIVGPGDAKVIRLDSTVTFNIGGPDWRFGFSIVDCYYNAGTALVTEGWGTSPYDKSATLHGGIWIGPGQTVAGSIGMLVTGSSADKAPAGGRCVGSTFKDFETARKIGDNGYNFTWENCQFHSCDICFHFPSGLSNAGERLSDIGCSLYNSKLAVKIEGVCNYHSTACSYDYNLQSFLMTGAGNIVLTSCHMEIDAAAITGIPIEITDSGAQFAFMGGRALALNHPTWTPSVLAFIHCDGDATFDGVRFFGLLAPEASGGKFDAGSGNVRLGHNSYLDTSQMTGIRKVSCLREPGFENNDLKDDMIFLTEDTAAITDPHLGDALDLSISSGVTAADGTYCLRAAKKWGAGSQAGFAIAVPCKPGDLIFSSADILDNDNRSGTIFMNMRWLRVDGLDANGVLIFVQETAGSIGIDPSDAWTSYRPANHLQGGPSSRAPEWATHFALHFNMNGFAGGTGAAEDGGDYSLYFDNIGIYRWS
ncbi:MAG: hypothetical protein KUG65_00535 [Sphingomonadaceae bacterium]|nr:hypothetical protein [Sphingomonadaceae bacterium]